ncbi:type II toxin-antitoxin system VapC family toxin [Spirosoma pomorum]
MILDSNILIYFVDPGYERLREYLEQQETELFASLISKLEVLGYHQLTIVNRLDLERLLGNMSILPISNSVIDKAIQLRQQRRRSLSDSIIAATALLYNLPVLTNNVADFSTIDGLRVISLTDVMNA